MIEIMKHNERSLLLQWKCTEISQRHTTKNGRNYQESMELTKFWLRLTNGFHILQGKKKKRNQIQIEMMVENID